MKKLSRRVRNALIYRLAPQGLRNLLDMIHNSPHGVVTYEVYECFLDVAAMQGGEPRRINFQTNEERLAFASGMETAIGFFGGRMFTGEVNSDEDTQKRLAEFRSRRGKPTIH